MFEFKFGQVIAFLLFVCAAVFLIASLQGSDLGAAIITTPTPTALPTCQVTDKFYLSEDGALGARNRNAKIVANGVYNLSQPPSNNLEGARNAAIDFLAFETERWSHFEEFKLDDENSVRVMLTFISPELVRAVLVNHVLLNTTESPLAGLTLEQFSDRTLAEMDTQNRYMFLIAFQPVSNNESKETFTISVSQAVLLNNGGTSVKVIHHDNFLDQTFSFASEPHAGFLYYPFGTRDGACKRVLDPVRDTSITLSIEGQFGKTEKRTVTLEIPFSSPLQVAGVIPTPNPNLGLLSDQKWPLAHMNEVQLTKPPENDPDWQKLGRFVWEKLTLDQPPTP